MHKFLVAIVALAIALLALASLPSQVRAQQAIVVQSDEPHNDFPLGVTFGVTFNAPAPPKEVRIQYSVAPDGTGATAVSTCTGDATISCSFKLSSTLGIIPGAAITYHWNIEDTAGDKLSTPAKLYVHQDNRFTFNEPRFEDAHRRLAVAVL